MKSTIRNRCKTEGFTLLSLLIELSLVIFLIDLSISELRNLKIMKQSDNQLRNLVEAKGTVNEIATLFINSSDNNLLFKSYKVLSRQEIDSLLPEFQNLIHGDAIATIDIDLNRATPIIEAKELSVAHAKVRTCRGNLTNLDKSLILLTAEGSYLFHVQSIEEEKSSNQSCYLHTLARSRALFGKDTPLLHKGLTSRGVLIPFKSSIFMVTNKALRIVQLTNKVIENQPLISGVKSLSAKILKLSTLNSWVEQLKIELKINNRSLFISPILRSAKFKPLTIFTYLRNHA